MKTVCKHTVIGGIRKLVPAVYHRYAVKQIIDNLYLLHTVVPRNGFGARRPIGRCIVIINILYEFCANRNFFFKLFSEFS